MRAVPVVVVLLLALAACGGSTVSVGDSSDGGGAASSGDGTCAGAQGPYCPWNGCLDGPQATCSKGAWVCPPPPSSCRQQCTAQPRPDCKCGQPTCASGRWQCPASCAEDAGADAGTDAAVDASATFPCGGLLVCHSAAEYCKIGVGGPPGAHPSYACEPIPTACANNVACACIKAAVGGQICSDAPGVTVTFEYP